MTCSSKLEINLGRLLSESPRMWQNFVAQVAHNMTNGQEKADLIEKELVVWKGSLKVKRGSDLVHVLTFADEESFLAFRFTFEK